MRRPRRDGLAIATLQVDLVVGVLPSIRRLLRPHARVKVTCDQSKSDGPRSALPERFAVLHADHSHAGSCMLKVGNLRVDTYRLHRSVITASRVALVI